jgi:hypothetical protein
MYDQDITQLLSYKINEENEFLGSSVIELEKALIEKYAIFNSYNNPEPIWIQLKSYFHFYFFLFMLKDFYNQIIILLVQKF